jgi:uncharacterized protein (DUF58 family)
VSNAGQERWELPGTGRARAGPTPEFWRYLWFPAVFSVAALLLRQDLVFLLGALVVGCGAAAYPLCRTNLRGVRVDRTLPPRARVGTPASLSYAVANEGNRSAVGLDVEDRPHRAVRPATVRFEVPCLGAGRRVTGQAEVVFARRGRVALAPPRLSSRFPLGVFRCVAAPGVADEILVRPREGRPTPALLRRLRGRSREQAARLAAARGSDALYGVREFRDGDDPRRIHWRSSARRAQTLIADWRAEDGLEVLLVLARAPARSDPRGFERAVSVTATVWRTLHRLGRPCRLVLGTGGNVGGSGGRVLGAGLDALALVRPSVGRRPMAALRRFAPRARAHAVVVVTAGGAEAALTAARAVVGTSGDAWVLPAEGAERARWVAGVP